MLKLAEGCLDEDILKDAKLLDDMSYTMKNNEYSSRLSTFVCYTNECKFAKMEEESEVTNSVEQCRWRW